MSEPPGAGEEPRIPFILERTADGTAVLSAFVDDGKDALVLEIDEASAAEISAGLERGIAMVDAGEDGQVAVFRAGGREVRLSVCDARIVIDVDR
jgi:hypothetical protein